MKKQWRGHCFYFKNKLVLFVAANKMTTDCTHNTHKKRAEKGVPKAIYFEAINKRSSEEEECCIDHKGKETECKECNRKCEHNKDWPQDGIEDSENHRRNNRCVKIINKNTGHIVRD